MSEQENQVAEELPDQNETEQEAQEQDELKQGETEQGETEQEETKGEETKQEEPESEDEETEYVCPPEFDERLEMRKMFVGGVDAATTEEEFKELFSKYGNIEDLVIIRGAKKPSDRLFGFVTFEKCDELEECLLNRPHKYKEKELDVKRAVPRGQEDNYGHYKVKKLHVANIPADMKEKELMRYLKKRHPKKYGEFQDVNFLKTSEEGGTEKNRGFGFIDVTTEDFADRVAIAENKFTLNGHNLRIAKAKPRNQGNKGQTGRNFGGFGQYERWDGYGGYYGYGYGGGYPYPPYGVGPMSGRGGYAGNRYRPY